LTFEQPKKLTISRDRISSLLGRLVKLCAIFYVQQNKAFRALSSSVPNAKYLTFGTPNTKKHLS